MTQQELGQRIADARRARRWTQGELADALEVSVLDLLRAGQRPTLAIAARLGHFRDPGAVDRALRRAGTLIGLGELLESLLEAAPAGPASPRLGEAGRAGSGGLEPIAELLQRPDRDQLRQELDDAGLAPDDVGLDAADPAALDEALEDQAMLAAGRRPGRVSRDRFA